MASATIPLAGDPDFAFAILAPFQLSTTCEFYNERTDDWQWRFRQEAP